MAQEVSHSAGTETGGSTGVRLAGGLLYLVGGGLLYLVGGAGPSTVQAPLQEPLSSSNLCH